MMQHWGPGASRHQLPESKKYRPFFWRRCYCWCSYAARVMLVVGRDGCGLQMQHKAWSAGDAHLWGRLKALMGCEDATSWTIDISRAWCHLTIWLPSFQSLLLGSELVHMGACYHACLLLEGCCQLPHGLQQYDHFSHSIAGYCCVLTACLSI